MKFSENFFCLKPNIPIPSCDRNQQEQKTNVTKLSHIWNRACQIFFIGLLNYGILAHFNTILPFVLPKNFKFALQHPKVSCTLTIRCCHHTSSDQTSSSELPESLCLHNSSDVAAPLSSSICSASTWEHHHNWHWSCHRIYPRTILASFSQRQCDVFPSWIGCGNPCRVCQH